MGCAGMGMGWDGHGFSLRRAHWLGMWCSWAGNGRWLALRMIWTWNGFCMGSAYSGHELRISWAWACLGLSMGLHWLVHGLGME